MNNINKTEVGPEMRENILERMRDIFYSNERYYDGCNAEVLRDIQDNATVNQLLSILFTMQAGRFFKLTARDYLTHTVFLNQSGMVIGIETDGYTHS